MKLVFKIASVISIMTSAASAATIAVSAGTSSQGIYFYSGTTLLASNEYNLGVGRYDALTSTFGFFGTPSVDTGTNAKANGSFTATSPTSFNSQVINLFVGTGTDIASSGDNWVVFRTASSTAFPANVTAAGSTTFSATTAANLVVVAKGNAGHGFFTPATSPGTSGGTFQFVPEPSSALLGCIGVLALLRRRRN